MGGFAVLYETPAVFYETPKEKLVRIKKEYREYRLSFLKTCVDNIELKREGSRDRSARTIYIKYSIWPRAPDTK